MDYELMFEVEHEGVTYTIGIDKVGGGTVGLQYDSEYWDWHSEPDSDEERTGRFHVGGYATHLDAAKVFLQMLKDGGVDLAEDLSGAVTLGAELLDLFIPKWYLLIDIEVLDLSSPLYCILGQIFGRYKAGLEAVVHFESDVDGNTHGFDADNGRHDELNGLWKAEIARRSE